MTTSEEEFRQVLRVFDASLNRVGEGLRFLEELARFLFNDTAITGQLKTLRHDLLISDMSFQQQLIESRQADEDIGSNMKVPGEVDQKNLPALLVANSRRVQESLRTLEELSRINGIPLELNTDKFRQARFSVYTIEKELFSMLHRQNRRKRINGLYVIIDTHFLRGRSPVNIATQAIRGGAQVIQLRAKTQDRKEVLEIALELKTLCEELGAFFIINDYVDVALAVKADGLHLGQDDLPVAAARKLLPIDCIIGCSVTDKAQAIEAQSSGADYVAVGAVYPTESKVSATTPVELVGLEVLREVKQTVSVPVVAIGGINGENVSEVMIAGADSVAVISAVLGPESAEDAARIMTEAMEEYNDRTNR